MDSEISGYLNREDIRDVAELLPQEEMCFANEYSVVD